MRDKLEQKIVELMCEIEKIPASEQQTKISVMAGDIRNYIIEQKFIEPMSKKEIKKIIKSSWLNTNARADLLKLFGNTAKLEKINREQCKELTEKIYSEVRAIQEDK